MTHRATPAIDIAALLSRSDRDYFRLGARSVEIAPGLSLCWMEGLEDLPAACVAHVESDAGLPGTAFADLEDRVLRRGSRLVRVYVEDASAGTYTLAASGYASRTEIGFVREAGAVEDPGDVVLRGCHTEDHWDLRSQLYTSASTSPDGYWAVPRAWAEMERRKCATRAMEAYFVESSGEPVGTLCVIPADGLLRVKNLFVRPEARRRGVARRALEGVGRLSQKREIPFIGCFAVAGEPGECLYDSLGFSRVGEQVEWTKALAAS